MARKGRRGIALIAIGVVLASIYFLWADSRNLEPLTMPLALSQGHERVTFKTNVSYWHFVNLDVKSNKSLDELNCDFGVNPAAPSIPPACGGAKPKFNLDWVLSTDGAIVARFSSNKNYGGENEARGIFVRSLSGFEGRAGDTYVLDIDIHSDARSLSNGTPTLRVEVSTMYEEILSVGYLLVSTLSSILILVGTILFWTSKRKRPLEVQ